MIDYLTNLIYIYRIPKHGQETDPISGKPPDGLNHQVCDFYLGKNPFIYEMHLYLTKGLKGNIALNVLKT